MDVTGFNSACCEDKALVVERVYRPRQSSQHVYEAQGQGGVISIQCISPAAIAKLQASNVEELKER